MPTVKQSAKAPGRGWTKAPPRPPVTAQTPASESAPSRSPFMVASMPLMASTADAFQRQFYSTQNLPSQRILPAKRGGG
jgi:hypothetical protein